MIALRALAAFALVAAWLVVDSPASASTVPVVAVTVNDRHALGTRGRDPGESRVVAVGAAGSAVLPAPIAGKLFEKPTGSPLGEVLRRMRAGLTYDADSRELTVLRGRLYPSTLELEATATVGSKRLSLTRFTTGVAGGPLKSKKSSRTMSVAPLVIGGTVYAPVRQLCEALGAYVEWVPSRETVASRVQPPSPEELAAEGAALAKIKAIGQRARQRLDDAARNLK